MTDKPILIVGGGPAGLSAAHAIASSGRKAVIVEKEDRLGGAPILQGYAKLVPSHEWAKDAIGGMVTRVQTHANVTTHLNAQVQTFTGAPGAFAATLKDGTVIEADSAILAIGLHAFSTV